MRHGTPAIAIDVAALSIQVSRKYPAISPKNRPSVNPINAAAIASVTVLPTARITSVSTGRPVAMELPRSPLTRPPQPEAELHRQRTVETVGDPQLLGEFLRCIGRQHRDQWIAGRDMHEQKAHQRHADDDRDHIDDTPDDIDEHDVLSE